MNPGRLFLAAACFSLTALPAAAQYPGKPIRFIVPFPPGGGVDIVAREITVLLSTGIAVFDVPPDCPILLHGERIKLRMVQLHDHVRIAYACSQGLLIVLELEVMPDSGLACFRL